MGRGGGAPTQRPELQVCPLSQQVRPQICASGQVGPLHGAMQRGFSFGGSVQQPLFGESQK
jgi:hypothetical protein